MGERLTDPFVKGLTCPPGKKDVLIFDDDLRGFGVRVQANGRKSFLLQYVVGGAKRRLPLGVWGAEVTTAEARKRAEGARGEFRKGRDPVAERKAADTAARAERTAEQFTVEKMIDTWRDLHLTERAESYRRRVPKELKAALKAWLTKPARAYAKADAIAVLDSTKAARGPVASNRLRATARACWEWTVERGDLDANPWASTPKPTKESSRDRVLSDDELVALWRAAEAEGQPWAGIVHLLILTGQRRSEVADLPWAELGDLNQPNPVWTLGKERAKNGVTHRIPLTRPVLDTLGAVPRQTGARLVFENAVTKRAPSGFGRVKLRLDAAMGEGVSPWTMHDLRRTCATGLQRLGVPVEVIESVLNHKSAKKGIVAVYQRHDFDAEKRVALDAWAAHVVSLVGAAAKVPKATVVKEAQEKRHRGRPKGQGLALDGQALQALAAAPGAGGKAIVAEMVKEGRVRTDNAKGGDPAGALAKRLDRLLDSIAAEGSTASARLAAMKRLIEAMERNHAARNSKEEMSE